MHRFDNCQNVFTASGNRCKNPHIGHASVLSIIRPNAYAAFQDCLPMIFLEIPYEQGSTHTWYLDGLAEGRKVFHSRVEALSFAMQSAKAATYEKGAEACIAIQGADGAWRVFNPDMLPLR